MVNSIHLNK